MIVWHDSLLTRAARFSQQGFSGACVWMTGLSGAGKSTLGVALEASLVASGRPAYRLDGDNLRHGLCHGLGFADADRRENVRRAGEAAFLLADAGLVAIVCLISPFAADRASARARMGDLPFFEVYVSTPVGACRARDPKGLYAARTAGLTGVDAPYEPPLAADIVLDTTQVEVEDAVRQIRGVLS
jgi:bifunctional enzyme CysN/CysC